MAVMGRKKQMVRQIIMNRRASRNDEIKGREDNDQISKEEHENRLKMLKDMGVLR